MSLPAPVQELIPWYQAALKRTVAEVDAPGLFCDPGHLSAHDFWWSICQAIDAEMLRRLQKHMNASRAGEAA